MTEPFVVCTNASPATSTRLVRLADVLVTAWDGGHELFAPWFRACPGLSLVLLVRPDRTIQVGTRDGGVTSRRLDPSMSVRLVAVAVYHDWVAQFTADESGPR